ncbi:hypothetical protein BCR32DRAFT_241045 [Anaeromyces robustus]|uniref:Uncharacterized protein n=1 Tax=Anaeromyces robustus TaxID=1754192 RepID=A0A1Y1XKU9_9FUNG|nr:hypothetical protein BCR32DRAFT_241045 [Anaeromyces robustus]|eukprot:ORX86332.1 hypothetical protein BCR32DRAFT_241045 [Anaeromyces robustus]
MGCSVDILKSFDATESRLDRAQKIYTKIPEHYTFAWTFIVLLLIGRKRWKNPVTHLIILHIIVRDIGLLIENIGKLIPYQYPGYDYPSNGEYMWGHALSRIAYYICEIIGDWYLLLRTKALVKSREKIKWVYITCLMYNIAKLSKIYFNYLYIPYKNDFNPERDDFDYFLRKVEYKKNKWICDFFQHIACTIYDITVFITLKKNVFVNNKNITHRQIKGDIFIEKFRRLSIYRIYFSIILSLFCSPLIFLFCIKLIYALNNIDSLKNEEKIAFYKANCNDTEIENIRVTIINVNYALINQFEDQMLLNYKDSNNDNNSIKNKSRNRSYSENSIITYDNNHGKVKKYNSANRYNKEKNKYYDIMNNNNILSVDYYKIDNNNNNNDNISIKNKSLNRSYSENSFIKYDNNHGKVNKYNSANRYNKEKNKYYDIMNNNNNMSVDYYKIDNNNNDSNNNPGWKKHYNSLNHSNHSNYHNF